MIAPSSLMPATIGRTSIWFVAGAATSLVTFVILGVMFDLQLPWPDALLVIPLVVLTSASTYCLSLFLGTLVTRQPRMRNIILTLLIIVARAFCGVTIPVAFWPEAVQFVVRLLPITHGLDTIRLLLDEGSVVAILRSAGLEVAVGAGWILLAMLAMDRMANAGRKDGTIELI